VNSAQTMKNSPISSPSDSSEAEPNLPTVKAIAPNAPSGANYMT
jgi:hypothetical protein